MEVDYDPRVEHLRSLLLPNKMVETDRLFGEKGSRIPVWKLRALWMGPVAGALRGRHARYVANPEGHKLLYGSLPQESFARIAHNFCTMAVTKLRRVDPNRLKPVSLFPSCEKQSWSLCQPIDSFRSFLEFIGFARWIVARTASTQDAEHFGALRFGRGLFTPISSHYLPKLTYEELKQEEGLVVSGSPDRYHYTVWSGDPKDKVAGTLVKPHAKGKVWWHHSQNYREHMVQGDKLFRQILAADGDERELPRMLGTFYHAMSNAAFYERGSAAATQWAFNILCDLKGIEVPDAVAHLDCYAISMSCKRFLQKHFLPMMAPRGALPPKETPILAKRPEPV